MPKDSDYFVNALARGLSVIESFGPERTRQTLADVARATGLNRATARRLLYTLLELGYVDLEGNRFALNSRALRLGYAYLSSLSFWELAQTRMDQLADQHGESWALGVLEGHDVVFVARVQSARQLMAINLNIGSRLPVHASGTGRVLLSGLSDQELMRYLRALGPLEARTPHTLTTSDSILAKVQEARRQGWTISNQEYEYGLLSLAVPVKDDRGRVIAGLNVGSHVSRIRPEDMCERFLEPLLQAAADIGRSAKELGE